MPDFSIFCTERPGLRSASKGIGIDETDDRGITKQFDIADDCFGIVREITAAGYIFDGAERTTVRTTESGGDETKAEPVMGAWRNPCDRRL